MADVGTHLADLALWLAFPDQAIDHRTEVAVVDADGWSLVLSAGQFEDVTGLAAYPGELFGQVVGGLLNYAGNNRCAVVVRGLHVRLTTLWEYEAPSGGGDTHQALARGSKATVAVRQEPGGVPELFIAAAGPAGHKPLAQALTGRCAAWQRLFPGVQIEDRGDELRLAIPAALRVGHELHFAEVMEEFARYFHTPRAVPSWERSNALARYFITTRAVEIARGKRGMVDSSQNPQ
jgi:hypothetical protein